VAATPRRGPAGAAFYAPPSPLPGKAHGDLIWTRALRGAPALRAAGSNRLVLYRSVGVDGKPVAVSGTVSVPPGRPPKGGWPVVTWGHGTTGIADACAPSRDSAASPHHLLISYAYPLLNSWLQRGYAVVRTDYEGLGTPGDHPYLVGDSEGRSVLDVVRAARRLDPRLGRNVVISGHSQGGQAALFAARLAPTWTPELKLRGTLAFAPASHLSEQVPLTRSLKDPSPLTALAAMTARGLDVARPALGVPALLSDRAAALSPQVVDRCLPELAAGDSFGGLAPAELFREDADMGAVTAALDAADDPENLKIRTPVRIEQGTADTTVFPIFTDQLVHSLKGRGTPLVYRTYKGVDHGGVVTAAAKDAAAWLKSRLK
jgi:hypothetical protein